MGITIDTSTLCQDIADAVVECCHDLICNCCCGGVTPIPPIPPIPPASATCSVCDTNTTPDYIKVTFGAGTNLGGNQSGCSGDCDDWAGLWNCSQFTQSEIDTLNASWPAAFTDQPSPTAGCYYGLTQGLPCGADALIVELLDGGSGGTALGAVTIGYPGPGYVRLDFQINSAVAGNDCKQNFNTGGAGCDNIGYSSDVSDPCDFVGALFDNTLMDIEAATVSFRANVKEAFYVKKEGVIGIDQSKLLVYLKKYPNLVR